MGNSETPFDYQSVPLKFPQKFRFVPFFPPGGGAEKGHKADTMWLASPPGVGLLVTGGTRQAGGAPQPTSCWGVQIKGTCCWRPGSPSLGPLPPGGRGFRAQGQSPGTPRDPRPRQQPPTGECSPEPPGCPQGPLQLPKGSAEPWPGRASDPPATCPVSSGRKKGRPALTPRSSPQTQASPGRASPDGVRPQPHRSAFSDGVRARSQRA